MRKIVSYTIEENILNRFKILCKKTGFNMSKQIELLITKFIDKKNES